MPITGYSNTISVTTLAPSFDPDAQAFFARVTAAGGTLTTTEQNATNQLVLDMKSAGIWTAMRAVYPMIGASAAACSQNLKSSSFTGTFTSGWTFASTGATPNGTSSYMNTGLVPNSVFTNIFVSVGVYTRTNNTTNGCDMGTIDIPGNASFELFSYHNGNTLNCAGDFGNRANYATTNSSRFRQFSRNTTTSMNVYLQGVLQATNTTLDTTSITGFLNPFYVGSRNFMNNVNSPSNKETAFNYISDGLTDTQASNLYTAVQAFQTTLSRQV